MTDLPLEELIFPDEIINGLSTDQRLLLEYVKVVSSSRVESRFASWKIGPLNHARWLTLAIRLLCLNTQSLFHRLVLVSFQVSFLLLQVFQESW